MWKCVAFSILYWSYSTLKSECLWINNVSPSNHRIDWLSYDPRQSTILSMIPIVQESETHVFFKLTMSHGILSRGTTRTDTHTFFCRHAWRGVRMYVWLCYGKQLVKLGQLWQRVNVYDYVGRYFDQASQIHITSSSVVIQLLVYDVHVEVKVEKWLLTPNIHTRIISCLSITTQTILKAKWCTQTSGLQVMLFSNATSYRPNFYRVAWICGWWGHLVLRSRRRRTWTKILNVWQDVTRRQNLQNIVHYRYWAFMFVDFCALWGAFAWQSGWCSPGNGKWNRLYETCLKRAILIDE